MRKIILILVVIFLVPACGNLRTVSDPVKRFEMLTNQKRELTNDYFRYLKDSNRNDNKLKELDSQILSINKEILKLSSIPEVREYIEQKRMDEDPSVRNNEPSTNYSQADIYSSDDRVEYISDDLEDSKSKDFTIDESEDNQAHEDLLDTVNEEYLGDTIDLEMEKDFNQGGEVEYEDDVSQSSEGNDEPVFEDSGDVEYYDDDDLEND